MKECLRCGKENEDATINCVRCGSELARQFIEVQEVQEEPTLRCYWHPNVATGLACGRCGKPLCTRCVILGPAGPRCRECAKSHVAIRPGAVVLGAKRGISGLFAGMGYFRFFILFALLGFLVSTFRSCMSAMNNPQPPIERDSDGAPPENSPPARGGNSSV